MGTWFLQLNAPLDTVLGNLPKSILESSTICAHAHSTATAHASILKKCAKMSCEPGRRSHYSGDLCWRIIWQREGLGLSLREILENLSVDVSSASRIIALFHSSGSVQKLPYPQNRRPTKRLTDPIEMFYITFTH